MRGVNQQAVDELKGHFEQKLRDWSQQVKIKGGQVCERCGLGLMDKELLESHHIEPIHLSPARMYDIDNGECICLWRHALKHKDNPVIQNMILLRLVVLLTDRLYKNQKTPCQEELEKLCPNKEI